MSLGRQNALQVIHYLRIKVNFNDAGIASGVGKQWLPKGALILGTDVYIGAVFNAATTNVLLVGTVGDANNLIVAAGDVDETAVALTKGIKPTGAALGPLAAPKQVQVTYTQTGTAATAGTATIVIAYVPDNDQ
ncbi:hypothetical protein [Bradyrhizobium sp. OK095]|uniref:hypothetical protein n=1 Tax=Bradyrhizobium sp. OK095 TaxID=1882760 RepID=UPI0008D1144C|nr:hypothetical protein [Bradyrhizobium sp. OK095]SEN66852.1 hypothetical protein SAMN05443254_11023 [Bradyrhizobium sp. OK095]